MAAVVQQAWVKHLLFLCGALFSIAHLLTGCGDGGDDSKPGNFLGCVDNPDWNNGKGYGCTAPQYTSWLCQDGEFSGIPSEHNYPDQNCCNCGKGSLPTRPTPAPPKSPPTGCVDTPGWSNGAMGCNVYNFMCNGGSFWGNPSQHNYPDQNCCKCGKGGPTPAPPKSPPRDKVSDQEWEHYQLVKQLRRQPTLAFECRLWKASQLHSQDMLDRGYFSHGALPPAPNGETAHSRAAAQGFDRYAYSGENINCGTTTGRDSFKALKNSPGHYATMIAPEHTLFAVAHGFNLEQSGSATRWTQMYGKSGAADTSCLNSWQRQSLNLATLANISNISGSSDTGYDLENASHVAVVVPDIVP